MVRRVIDLDNIDVINVLTSAVQAVTDVLVHVIVPRQIFSSFSTQNCHYWVRLRHLLVETVIFSCGFKRRVCLGADWCTIFDMVFCWSNHGESVNLVWITASWSPFDLEYSIFDAQRRCHKCHWPTYFLWSEDSPTIPLHLLALLRTSCEHVALFVRIRQSQISSGRIVSDVRVRQLTEHCVSTICGTKFASESLQRFLRYLIDKAAHWCPTLKVNGGQDLNKWGSHCVTDCGCGCLLLHLRQSGGWD